jgi:tetratricopeptide (TPR) repeat protein
VSVALLENEIGPQHPDTAQSLNNLGALLDSMGDYEAARPYYERALAIFEARLGPDHPHTQRVRGNLAKLSEERKK